MTASRPVGTAEERARAARRAQRRLGGAPGERRTAALTRLGELLSERQDDLLAANRRDLEAASQARLAGPLLHRLGLTAEKLATLRRGVESLAAGADPLGRATRRTELDDGLVLTRVTSPLGVLLVIFESRPDAVIQIGSLAIRSGNAVLLKGGAEAEHSNRALVACLRDALAETASDTTAVAADGSEVEAVQGVTGREEAAALLEQDEWIDLVIPRGSGELVRRIQSSTRIPVLGHAEGVCHLYLDAAADPEMATRIALDSKCGYPAACNAAETLLVHRNFLPRLTAVGRALADAGVRFRADPESLPHLPGAEAAEPGDWRTEWGDLILSVRTVGDVGAAIEHIHAYGSAHTDAIVTADRHAAERFLAEVDSASVFHNASTRFADGYRYGLGAEVGIATGRIHARGPVGVEGLLTSRWLLSGNGQTAADYGPEGRSYRHRELPLS